MQIFQIGTIMSFTTGGSFLIQDPIKDYILYLVEYLLGFIKPENSLWLNSC